MRQLLAGVLGLALLAPSWADDNKSDKPAAAKPPKEQVADLAQAFDKEMRDLIQQFRSAEKPEEKEKIKDKATKQVPADYAKKMLEIATKNPKDPAAVDALAWVCTTDFVGRTPQAAEALKVLLKDHADSPKFGEVCKTLAQQPEGERTIRQVRAKATNPAAKLEAGFYLAEAIQENDAATPAQLKEAEKLLEEVASAKGVKGLSPELVQDAAATVKLFAGKPAPASAAKDLDDKAVALADHKGKVVVLDFWATWCPPCRGMIPHERELVKKNAGKPFVFVSVSADDAAKTVKDFVEKEPMPWSHWFAGHGGDILKTWRIQAFPTIYVIDAKGVIRGKIVGGGSENEKKLDEMVDKLVKEADGKSAE